MDDIIFAGDTHGPLDHLTDIPASAVVIHVGDLAPLSGPLEHALPKELHHRFFFIPGNHDFDHPEFYENIHTEFARSRNFDMTVFNVGDVRIAGLGRVFAEKIWYPKSALTAGVISRAQRLRATPRQDRFQGGLGLKQRTYIFREDFDALARQRAHILVTHEAPTTHKNGFAAIDELAQQMGAHTIVHGHHHEDYRAKLPGGIQVIGVGLCGLTSLSGQVLRAGLI